MVINVCSQMLANVQQNSILLTYAPAKWEAEYSFNHRPCVCVCGRMCATTMTEKTADQKLI